jgi:hypothetical protein
MAKKENIEIALGAICYIGLVIYAVVVKKYAALIVLGIILLFIVGLMIWANLSIRGIKKTNKKINDKYHILKEKTERTVFEECYVLSIKEELEKKIHEEVKINKIKEVGNIFSDISDLNTIDLCYRFRGFEVIIAIKENNITYAIDTPSRYDGTKNNDEFENKKKTDFSPKEFYDIDSFIKNIYSLMLEINSDIDAFSLENITDENFNGRMFNKIKPFKDFLKREGLVCVIASPFFIIFFIVGLYFAISDIGYRNENLPGYITCLILIPLFLGFFLFTFIYGIFRLVQLNNLKDDLNQKSFSIIEGVPTKVKISKEAAGRHSNTIFIRCIILYFDKVKLYISLPQFTTLENKKNVKAFYNECLNVKCKLKYLTKSKIVFDGENKYISLLREYLC